MLLDLSPPLSLLKKYFCSISGLTDLIQCFLSCLIRSEFFRIFEYKVKSRVKPNVFLRFPSSDDLHSGEKAFFSWGNKTILENSNFIFLKETVGRLCLDFFFLSAKLFALECEEFEVTGSRDSLSLLLLVSKVHPLERRRCSNWCTRLSFLLTGKAGGHRVSNLLLNLLLAAFIFFELAN